MGTNGFSADTDRQWFTAPDTGIYVLNSSVSVKSGTVQSAGDGVIINLYRRSPNGSTVSLATVREIVQASNDVQAVSAAAIVHLSAGDSIGVSVYLEAGSPSTTYSLQTGASETTLSAWMRAPAPAFAAASSPFVAAGDWTDGEQIAPALMHARITQPYRALYNPPRFSLRYTLPYRAPSNQPARVSWSLAGMEECGGWVLSRDGSSITAPAAGVYLVSVCLATQRDGPTGAFGSYQVHLVKNGELLSLRQRQNTRSDYPTSLCATEPVFLDRGETLATDLLGTGTGVTWRDYGNDVREERWNALSAVLLAPSATSMRR